jgi:hypothetical protein
MVPPTRWSIIVIAKPVGALFGIGNRGPDRLDRMLQTPFKGQRGVVAVHGNKAIGYQLAHAKDLFFVFVVNPCRGAAQVW